MIAERALKWPVVLGAICALIAVMAGAFGAHGLRHIVDARGLEVFQTAVTYQMYHALGLILLGLLAATGLSQRLLGIGAGFFFAGIVLFSGSLYLIVLTDIRGIGPITPLGGVCFMVGWILLAVAALRR